MTIENRIQTFSSLGKQLSNLSKIEIAELSRRAQADNQWFTPQSVEKALHGLAYMLGEDKLHQWVSRYDEIPVEIPKIVGIIMAGNIPLVGFHDLMCVLMSGHFAAVKTSSSDTFLTKTIIDWVLEIEPRFKKNIEIRERLNNVDAIIATGSDNTARHFEYYFKDIPRIIRKNRTSIAIINGLESKEDLHNLGKDIFTYYGLGCRNVSKVLVPKNYDPKPFFEAIEDFSEITNNHKYQNNYDYHKSILLVNGTEHLDNGFLLWQPSDQLVSPISVLFVEEYESDAELDWKISSNSEKLQCIVGHGRIPFGKAQSPEVWDYADNVDTMEFLKKLS